MKPNKQAAIDQYRAKWGLSEYHITIHFQGLQLFSSKCWSTSSWRLHQLVEICALKTLVKHLNSAQRIEVYEYDFANPLTFASKEELFHYTLTKKLAGI